MSLNLTIQAAFTLLTAAAEESREVEGGQARLIEEVIAKLRQHSAILKPRLTARPLPGRVKDSRNPGQEQAAVADTTSEGPPRP